MGIPWICSWHFTLAIALQDMPYSLLREFRVKWWGKYNIDRCSLGNIQKYFQIVNKTKTAIQTISKSTPLLNPSQISQKNPNSQTHKRPTSSPTSSTTSSSSQISSRKEKMKTFLAEMLDNLRQKTVISKKVTNKLTIHKPKILTVSHWVRIRLDKKNCLYLNSVLIFCFRYILVDSVHYFCIFFSMFSFVFVFYLQNNIQSISL
ncbi:unnamed protein product [Brassica oleracea]|uniref:(rape) hypothetical protein n=1 Tax=Brassica napus TaxID=3708 RepID=A0A816Q8U4_BRANA|nr:unnamed protein product [Brassica napus]